MTQMTTFPTTPPASPLEPVLVVGDITDATTSEGDGAGDVVQPVPVAFPTTAQP